MTTHYTRFIGIDIHKKTATYVMVDREKNLLGEGKLSMTALGRWAPTVLNRGDQVVIEATGNSDWVYDQLTPWVGQVVVANALAMHDRTRARRKTDRVDARSLAEALAGGYVAEVYVPTPAIREQREVASHRHALARQLTALRNQIRALLYRHGLSFPGPDILSPAAPAFVQTAPLSETTRRLLASYFRIGQTLRAEIDALDQQAAAQGLEDPNRLKLLTLPGIGAQAALIITAAVGEIGRFDSPKKLASYAGLVPSVRISDETVRYGPITKQGRSQLRWIMVEAAHAATQTPGPIRDRYQRLIRKGKHHNVALIAVARHLLELVWHLLTHHAPFRDATPKYLMYKLRTVLRRAHGRCPKNAAPTLANNLMGWKTRVSIA